MALVSPRPAKGLLKVAWPLQGAAKRFVWLAKGLPGVAMSLLRMAGGGPVERLLRNRLDTLDAPFPSPLLGLPMVMGLVKRRELG